MAENMTPASNRATWIDSRVVRDAETRLPTSIAEADEIEIQVSDGRCGPLLTGKLTSGEITRGDSVGYLEWKFTKSQMSRLCAGTYDVGIVATYGDDTYQIFTGRLPVLEGFVR